MSSAHQCPLCGGALDGAPATYAARCPVPEGFKLSVVMPCYNEKPTIRSIIERVKAEPIPKEIIVVDDFSADGTREVLAEYADDPVVRVLLHEENRGKGAALRTGFETATGDVVVIQDADLEYDPAEYHSLIRPILEGKADVVYGSRFIGGTHRVLFFWHYVGNRMLTTFSNMFTNLNLTDMETCYKVFRREVLDGMPLKCDRFGFEPEFTAKAARRGLRIYEIPISYAGRDYSEGKKINWKDGLAAVWYVVRFAVAD
jgi:glycosyltransferase involved in cell wall biosynthesis